jgi:malonyl CoA-acyl carrier protein transacylase
MSSSPRDPAERAVAVVGVGAILPAAPDAPSFWANVVAGRDCVVDVPPERWDPADYYDPDAKVPDKTYSKIGGWVRGFAFDPVRYRIPPKVAAAMDEGQQWMVVAAGEALKDAGHPDRALDLDRTAVIAGNAMGGERHYLTTSRHFAPVFRRALESTEVFRGLSPKAQAALMAEFAVRVTERLPETTEDTMPGELANIMAGRVAAVFNIRGPNFTTDAACASSLAALQAAIDGLVDHHYDAVISGGMDRNMGASTFIKFCKIGALSPDGSRPYAQGANGFVMGEGGALFVLKRLADAEQAGDRIYAVIRAVGASSDGKGKGITAPNPMGQVLAVRRAWERAGLPLNTVTLVEGHGTSTAVGDVAEVSALTSLLGSAGLRKRSIALGSVKSQIGHLKGGAGAASLLKAVLSLHHKVIPPSIHFDEPNPEIRIHETPFWVPGTAQPWERPAEGLRRVGISAFGFGGTNFHVVVEEHVPGLLTSRKTTSQVPATLTTEGSRVVSTEPLHVPVGNLVALGADSVEGLRAQLIEVIARARTRALPARESPGPAFFAAGERLVISFEDGDDLIKLGEATVAAFAKNDPRPWRLLAAKGVHRGAGTAGKVAFLYPGQGSQYVNMLRGLRDTERVVAETFAEADEVMQPLLGRKLSDYLFVDTSDPAVLARAEEELRATVITQPAVLTCEVALTKLLAQYGVFPDLVMGHSLGEWGALVAAGMLPFPDGLRAVSSRARGMASVSPPDPGKMASVLGPYEEISRRLSQMTGYVVAANLNAHNQTVIAGDTEAVLRAIDSFKQDGFTAQLLPVSHAFHSRIVAAASGPLRKVLDGIAMNPPRIPIVSNVDGKPYPTDMNRIREQLSIQLASPVQWVKSLETATELGARVLIEVGPKRVLRGFAEEVLGDRAGLVFLSTNHPKRGDVLSFHEGVCGLFAAGIPRPADRSPTETIPAIDTRSAPAMSKARSPAPGYAPIGATSMSDPTRFLVPPTTTSSERTGGPDFETLGRIFARCLEEGLSVYQGHSTGSATSPLAPSDAPALSGPTDRHGSVVISGGGIGLPGKSRRVFDDKNFDRILGGESFIEPVSDLERQRMVEKNIVRLVKRDVGEPSLDPIRTTKEVLKLAAQKGAFDLVSEFGIEVERAEAFDVTTALAIGAGLEALRDARIPLVRNYRRTTTGSRLPDRWLLPRCLADETGVIFSSAFPAQNALVDEIERFHADKLKRMILAELASYAPHEPRARERMAELEAELSRDTYVFSRKFLFKALAMGHAQFAELLGARGPNTLINSACASGTQAVGIANDWIRLGKCRRVIVITADDATSDQLFQWIGTGFLASGAASTEERVELAALPFDRRRNGTLLGMGAAALVIEAQDALEERGMRGVAEILATESANSAFHGTRLDVDHIGEVVERVVSSAERNHGLSRDAMAREMIFMSHETYTPARGGSAAAEVNALRKVFGANCERIVVANTKGFTGHPMGVAVEDVVALKALEKQIVPPVPNFREPDPDLGMLNLSKGGHYPIRYSLRFAAGFGSQISLTLMRRVPGCEERVAQPGVYEQWLSSISGYSRPNVEVDHRTLRIQDQGVPEREPAVSTWSHGLAPSARVQPEGGSQTPVARAQSLEPPSGTKVRPVTANAVPMQERGDGGPTADPVTEQVLALVSEKTGYPRDMLDLDLDLEADLGIDTVKQAEVFARVREAFDISRQDDLKLRDYPTLKHVIGFVRQHRPDLPASSGVASGHPVAAPGATPVRSADTRNEHSASSTASAFARDPVAERVLELVSEKTGYPQDMLDLDLDLEADLGIDTVKQAEVFARVRETFDITRQDDLKLRDYPTLKHVIGFVRQNRPDLAAPPPAPAMQTAPVALKAVAPSAPSAGEDPIVRTVLAVVSDKTGYPPDMLELDLDLEADLGIDTVKQAEVFAIVRETFQIPRKDDLKLRDYPTLKHVIGFVRDNLPNRAAEMPSNGTTVTSASNGHETGNATAKSSQGSLLRVPVPTLRPAVELCKTTAAHLGARSRALVVSDRGGVGAELSGLLRSRGVDVTEIVDAPSPEGALTRVADWANGGLGGIYFLTALDPTPPLWDIEPDAWRDLNQTQIRLLCAIARSTYEMLGTKGAFLISATRLGGLHGYDAEGATSPAGGAVTGFTKAMARERPAAVVKAVDFAQDAESSRIARALIAETERDGDSVEVGYRDGNRFAIAAVEADRAPRRTPVPMNLDASRVFVVTGGAGAITSAIVLDLVRASRATFHLLDLLPTPDAATRREVERLSTDREGLKREIFERIKETEGRATPAQVEKRLFAIERAGAVLDTMRGVEAAGGKAHYHSVDVTALDGVTKAIEAVMAKSGRIDVVLHTAGLERSRTFDTKPQSEFDLVYDVKATGLYNLVRATRNIPVGAFVCFSSVAGRFGNAGQADYSAANDFMCKVCSSLNGTRAGVIATALDWSAWGGIGMATRGSVPEMMRRAGIEMLDPNEATPLVRQVLTTGTAGEAVVGRELGVLLERTDMDGGIDRVALVRLAEARCGLPVTSVSLDKHTGLTLAVTMDPTKEPFLRDHQIDGTAVLPGVMGLELFAQAATLLSQGSRVEAIENVEFAAPLKFYRHEPRTVVVRVLLLRDLEGRIRARCVLESSQALAGGIVQDKQHFSADVLLGDPSSSPASRPVSSDVAATVAHPSVSSGTIDGRAIYRVYFHGPAYQVLSRVDLRSDGAIVGTWSDTVPSDRSDPSRPWLFAPRLIELCFQTAGVYEIGRTGHMGLPAGAASVRVYAVPPSTTALRAEVRSSDSSSELTFDAVVRGGDGVIYAELERYRTITLPGSVGENDLAHFRSVGQPAS